MLTHCNHSVYELEISGQEFPVLKLTMNLYRNYVRIVEIVRIIGVAQVFRVRGNGILLKLSYNGYDLQIIRCTLFPLLVICSRPVYVTDSLSVLGRTSLAIHVLLS